MARDTSARGLLSAGYAKASPRPQTPTQAPESASQAPEPPEPAPTPPAGPTPPEGAKVTYQRVTTYLTPDLRAWITATVGSLYGRSLSGSDITRLALQRLRAEVDAGLDLPALLAEQAHREAALLPGRRNRGMPDA